MIPDLHCGRSSRVLPIFLLIKLQYHSKTATLLETKKESIDNVTGSRLNNYCCAASICVRKWHQSKRRCILPPGVHLYLGNSNTGVVRGERTPFFLVVIHTPSMRAACPMAVVDCSNVRTLILNTSQSNKTRSNCKKRVKISSCL